MLDSHGIGYPTAAPVKIATLPEFLLILYSVTGDFLSAQSDKNMHVVHVSSVEALNP